MLAETVALGDMVESDSRTLVAAEDVLAVQVISTLPDAILRATDAVELCVTTIESDSRTRTALESTEDADDTDALPRFIFSASTVEEDVAATVDADASTYLVTPYKESPNNAIP